MNSACRGSESEVFASVPDYSRENKLWFEWNPPRSLFASIRSYQRRVETKSLVGLIFQKIDVVRHCFWSIVTGADIPLNCKVGGGLLVPNPNDIVIHPSAVIGVNCLTLRQAIIGVRNGDVQIIGGHVDIGVGAKIL